MGWEVQPEGLTRLLTRVSADYAKPAGVPLYVTENGAAYDDVVVDSSGEIDGGEAVNDRDAELHIHDTQRTSFVRQHLRAVLDAIDAGADVRGFFYWSLMDNFEWAWGYSQRFGIVWVDYDSQRRIVKDSGHEYARIIAARALDGATPHATQDAAALARQG
jgi:beta-glucosidase